MIDDDNNKHSVLCMFAFLELYVVVFFLEGYDAIGNLDLSFILLVSFIAWEIFAGFYLFR